MKYLRYIVLIGLLIISLSLIGIGVLWLSGKILSISFDNIIVQGIKIGFLSSVALILMDRYLKKKRGVSEKSNL